MSDDRPARLNLRLPQSLLGVVGEAAALAGLSVSEWCRAAIEQAATRDLAVEHEWTRQSTSRLGMQMIEPQAPGRCQHPVTARVEKPLHDECGLCGTVTHRR